MFWWILGGILAAIIVGTIAYSAIRDYLVDAKKIAGAEIAELIKEPLDSGNVRVVANVLNRKGNLIEAKAWEGEEIDEELAAEFRGRSRIVYDLRA